MASYEQSPKSKLWSVRFRMETLGKVKNIRLSGYKTKREAQQAFVEHTTGNAKPSAKCPITFRQLYNEYFENQKIRVKESSYITTIDKANKNVLPVFGDMYIKDITPLDILKWQQSLSKYSYKYSTCLRTILAGILKFGERYYDMSSPMSKVESIRRYEPKKEMSIWSPSEFYTFISVVDKPVYKAYFTLLYYTGVRKGEAKALTWDDVDLNAGTISISKTLSTKVDGANYSINTPKTNSSVRTVQIPIALIDALKEYASTVKHEEFLFGGKEPLKDTTTDRFFKNWCTQAGVKKIRTHDIRHSHASYLISQGISIVAVSKRLGHSSVAETLNTYSHLMKSEQDRIIEILDKMNAKVGTNLGTKN